MTVKEQDKKENKHQSRRKNIISEERKYKQKKQKARNKIKVANLIQDT